MFCKLMMSVSKSNPILAALFLLLFLFFKMSYCIGNRNSSILIACPEIEKQSLFSLKQSLQDPDNLLSSWNGEVNCCMWKGVFCSNLTGHVHALHLQGLSGKINPSLLNLKHLKYLDLSQNNFNETIPSFIGSLTSLEYLNFTHAGFYGKIPHTIGNLSNLHTLSFEQKFRMLLEVDSLEWLSGLSKLEHLNMNYVDLSKVANWAQVIHKIPSLIELHFKYCRLVDFAHHLNDVNITSKLAVLDLSYNGFHPFDIMPRWIFQLSSLIYLDLRSISFEGPIPTISNTTKLQYIDLSWNIFNSTIPEWIYLCKDLWFVDFSNTLLQNEISESIANLTSLNTLDLSSNELSGKIPRAIGNLCKMQTLGLFGNKLQGEISDSFGNMSDCFLGALESLNLNDNQLSGHLTHQFGELKNLQYLDLSRNSISGVIPNNIGNLSSLEYLNLGGNKFSGNLPDSMGKLINLEGLDISDNMLEGVVTETHFAHLSKLTDLYASKNHFLTLKVSPDWIPPFKLKRLRLALWNLGSSSRIPSWLDTQKSNIEELDLSSTGISGNVPRWLWNVLYLNLSHNQLHGQIPTINGESFYANGQLVYLSSNKFSGSLPQLGNDVTELDLSDNSFSGDLSHFLCDTTTTNQTTYRLRILHLGGNKLSGELPDCFMKWPSLEVLNLGNNNLSGRIPTSIGFLENLRSLNLYGNKFSGQIPLSMQNCTQLLKVDLSDNDFEGTIPTWIGASLSYLWILILSSNKLSGEITSDICQLSSLQILDLSNNRISGIIPHCVNNFTAMAIERGLHSVFGPGGPGYSLYIGVFIESVSIATKGSKLHYDTILGLVTNIDLSRNNLSGDIPMEITSLVELRSLNLSRNHMTGLIPDSIGNMKQMESLDFSLNSLSGEMPNSFTVMSSLSYLNLSYNNLTGRIPESTQIRGFNESSFIGNNLCGPPLTSNCRNEGQATEQTNTDDVQDEEGNKPEIDWLYVFTFLGFAVGLSATITTLFFKKTWREAYFDFLENTWDCIYVYCYIKWTRLKRALGRTM